MNNNSLGSFKIPKKKSADGSVLKAVSPSRIRVNYSKTEDQVTDGKNSAEIANKPNAEMHKDGGRKDATNGDPAEPPKRSKRGRKPKAIPDRVAEEPEVKEATPTRKGRRKSGVCQDEAPPDVVVEPLRKRTRTQAKLELAEHETSEVASVDQNGVGLPGNTTSERADGDKKKPGRRRKSEQPETVTEAEPQQPKRRGKLKKQESQTTEETSKPLSNSASRAAVQIACGGCDQTFDSKKQFQQHVLTVHYGLARPKEESQEFNKTDEMRALKEAMAKLKKLVCPKCGKRYTSAGGYAYHHNLCGKTKEELDKRLKECPVCSVKVVVLDVHMKSHEKPPVTPVRAKDADETRGDDENSLNSKARRASAIKAGNLISKVAADGDGTDENRRNFSRAKWHFMAPGPAKVTNSITGAWKREVSRNGTATCRHPGCKFTSEDLDKMKDHHVNCEIGAANKFFSCLRCPFHSQFKNQMVDHVNRNHVSDKDKEVDFGGGEGDEEDDDDIDDDDATFSDEERVKKGGIGRAFLDPNTPSLIFRKPEVLPKFPLLLAAFHRENYSWHRPLYADWLPVKEPRKMSDLNGKSYLPAEKESEPFAFVPEANMKDYAGVYEGDVEWKKLRRFESHAAEDSVVFFCGDAISACAWCPAPNVFNGSLSENRNQYLAVATLNESQNKSSVLETRPEDSGSVQLWNCGLLDCHDQGSLPSNPKLAAVIIHSFGRIWNLEWCPSGAFNEDLNRLGLLAAACGDGTVKILAVPFPSQSEDSSVAFEADLCATLRLAIPDVSECTALSWDTTKDHRFILAGFANGILALWDIGTSSPLLKRKTSGNVDILPVWTIRGHQTVVTGVSLSPQYGAGRVFATVSIDRTLKLWDRYDSDVPVCILRRQRMTGVKWKKHWPCVAVAQDDCYALTRCRTFLYDFECSGQKQGILGQNSLVLDAAENEYFDALAHCTAAGEVVVVDGFVPFIDSDEFSRARHILLRTDLVNLDNDRREVVSRTRPEYRTNQAPESSESVKGTRILFTDTQNLPVINQYGILIHHYQEKTKLKKPNKRRGFGITSEKMDVYRPCDQPVASINKVAFNPNLQSHIWLCVCRENGMVQLVPVRGLSCPNMRDSYLAEYST